MFHHLSRLFLRLDKEREREILYGSIDNDDDDEHRGRRTHRTCIQINVNDMEGKKVSYIDFPVMNLSFSAKLS